MKLIRNLLLGAALATSVGVSTSAQALTSPTGFFYANLFCELESGTSSLCQVFPADPVNYNYSWNVGGALIVDGGCGNDDYCAVHCWANQGGSLSVSVTNKITGQVSVDSTVVGCGLPRRR